MNDLDAEDPSLAQLRGKLSGQRLGRHRHHLRVPSPALLEGKIEIGTSREGHRTEQVGVRFAKMEGGLTDGAGRTEQGNVLHRVYFRR